MDNNIKENWYELDYDCSGCDGGSPSVLYTSKSGLKALANELNRVASLDESERVALDIENMDYVHSIPFTHIEILEKPPENDTDDSWSWKPVLWIASIIAVIFILSGYGLVRLTMDIF